MNEWIDGMDDLFFLCISFNKLQNRTQYTTLIIGMILLAYRFIKQSIWMTWYEMTRFNHPFMWVIDLMIEWLNERMREWEKLPVPDIFFDYISHSNIILVQYKLLLTQSIIQFSKLIEKIGN